MHISDPDIPSTHYNIAVDIDFHKVCGLLALHNPMSRDHSTVEIDGPCEASQMSYIPNVAVRYYLIGK